MMENMNYKSSPVLFPFRLPVNQINGGKEKSTEIHASHTSLTKSESNQFRKSCTA